MKQKRLTVKVDPHTFGGSVTSKHLSNILNDQYPHLVSKVGAYYCMFAEHNNNCVRAAKHFPNGGLGIMMQLYKNHKFESIKKSGMPEIVITHLLNVMTYLYRKSIKIINENK
jgi:uncharacterized protein (DUF3820 family)